MKSVITGIGHYVPAIVKTNDGFSANVFYDRKKEPLDSAEEVIRKFEAITGIKERRYADANVNCSDMAAIAGKKAIENAGIDPETIDHIIVAHNFGDILPGSVQSDAVPSIASRVKHILDIQNPDCVAFDLLFGCPGWLQSLIQAHALILSGMAERCLVIGSEVLSRVIDPADRDGMLFSDGAGAVVLEKREGATAGIMAVSTQSYSMEDLHFIEMGLSNIPEDNSSVRYAKMMGRKVYEFALKNVPAAIQSCLRKAGVTLADVNMLLLHQANEKVVDAITRELYLLEGIEEVPQYAVPMNIQYLGNSSVATIPTLYSMVRNGELNGYHLNEGDLIVFAALGAGMNINAVCYRV